MSRVYLRDPSTFKPIAFGFGSCLASDRITVEGKLVGFMYREPPDNDLDSGWRFFAGDESEEYTADPRNFGLFDVNTVANYDPAILPHLDSSTGVAFVRRGDTFCLDSDFELPRDS